MVAERTGYRLDLYAPEVMRIENSSGYLCPGKPGLIGYLAPVGVG